MTVGELLRVKGSKVITTRPQTPLSEAIRTLVNAGVGCLVVVDATADEPQMVGILTERDILRENARNFDGLGSRCVADIMTEDVIIGLPDDAINDVMALMTEKRIRHLPIMSRAQLVGLISIGDVVKAKVRSSEMEIRHLTDYVTGKYPG
jgi:CBS domain-containing protein